MRVDIWSDIICPWCSVGKAWSEKALSTHAHRDVAVAFDATVITKVAHPGIRPGA